MAEEDLGPSASVRVAGMRAFAMRTVGRPTKLSRRLQEIICAMIQGGISAHIAAESVGVSRRTFFSWLERGEKEPESAYGKFLHNVQAARGQARAAAEAHVYRKNPHTWLREGPGRDGPGMQNWTDRQIVEVTGQPARQPVEIRVVYVDEPGPSQPPTPGEPPHAS